MRRALRLALLLGLLWTAGAAAQNSEIDARLNEEKAKLRAAMQAEHSLLRQLYAVDHLRYQHERDLAALNGQLSALQNELQKDQAEFQRLEAESPIRSARLSRRLGALYRMGRGGFWKVLLTSDSFSTFLRRYRQLKQVVRADAEALTSHRVQLLALRQRRAELVRRQAHLTAGREKEKQEALNVEIEKQKKTFMLAEIRRDKVLSERLARDLASQDAAVNQTVAALRAEPAGVLAERPLRLDFAQRKGNLPTPASGPIVGRFGMRLHQVFGTQTRSNGIDIAVPAGTSVHAVADGTVTYTGEFLGYGRVLIVDHGLRFHSMYAHLGSFARAKGDPVYQGDVIGTVGSSGLYAEPVLHFEIRHEGAAVDPLEWLRPTP